ncbi:DUF4169 family protein [Parvibaculum sp.]|jgi:hypothetical protein|uniref:DUF4169 family protein n=1 Tax=Parvibaculum sp. TaxID=2024848 RepID=UPI0032EF6D53
MDSDRGNIVNFASFKKTARAEKKRAAKKEREDEAAANRVKFGRSGAAKKRAKDEEKRRRRDLDGKQLERHENSGDPEDGAGA